MTEKQMTVADFEKEFAEKGEQISRPDIDGWYDPKFSMEKKQPLVGQVSGHMVIDDDANDGKRDIIIVTLAVPITAKEGGKPVELKAGQSIAVGVRHGLAGLFECIENKCKVMVKAEGQENLKGGKSVWKFDMRSIGKRAEFTGKKAAQVEADEARLAAEKAAARAQAGDDIPF